MKSIMERWAAGKLTTKRALEELGKLMAQAKAQGKSLAPFEDAVNQLIGLPDEPAHEDPLDGQAWERYRR